MAPRSTLLFWPIVFLVLCAGYLLFVGTVSMSEALACLPAIAAGLVVAVLYRHHAQRPMRVRPPVIRLLGATAAALCTDSVKVGMMLLRALYAPVTGRINVQPFDPGAADALSAGRRASVILATSLAPNAYVIRTTPEALLMHQLAPVPDATDRLWPV